MIIFTHKESHTKKGFGYFTVLWNLLKWMLQTLKSFITCAVHYKEYTTNPYCYKSNKVWIQCREYSNNAISNNKIQSWFIQQSWRISFCITFCLKWVSAEYATKSLHQKYMHYSPKNTLIPLHRKMVGCTNFIYQSMTTPRNLYWLLFLLSYLLQMNCLFVALFTLFVLGNHFWLLLTLQHSFQEVVLLTKLKSHFNELRNSMYILSQCKYILGLMQPVLQYTRKRIIPLKVIQTTNPKTIASLMVTIMPFWVLLTQPNGMIIRSLLLDKTGR